MISTNTNIASIFIQRTFAINQSNLNKTLEQLSTGCKINRAADNAANLAIAQKLASQISGNQIAQENVQIAANMVNTADDSLDVMISTAEKIRNLALQSMNGTYSADERRMMQAEVAQLTEEIYQQKNNTQFKDIAVFGESETPPEAATAEEASSKEATVNEAHIYKTDAEAEAAGYTVIHNAAEFAAIEKHHVDDGWSQYDYISGKYCLMGDIDFSQISDWGVVDLGDSYNDKVTGELNGNGYSIKNLEINSSTNSEMNGLFRNINGVYEYDGMTDTTLITYSVVKNLNLENVNIDTSNNPSSSYNAGALAGEVYYGTIENCTVSGSVRGNDYYTGGLIGNASTAEITSCKSSADVYGAEAVGGLVGEAMCAVTIRNSSATGSVTGTNKVGGLVGDTSMGSSTISDSYATGTVNGDTNVGGFIGYFYYSGISNSYATGDVHGNSNVGGFVGQNNSYVSEHTISTSYSTGNVTGSSNTGGFVGINGDNQWSITEGNINNCYTNSDLPFYGYNAGGTIENCYGTIMLVGVEGYDASWFENGSNLSFLGSAFDTSKNPPDLISNSRFASENKKQSEQPSRPAYNPSSATTGEGIQLQIGANSGEGSKITIHTEFLLDGYSADVSTAERAKQTVEDTDTLIRSLSMQQMKCGSTINRLNSISDSLQSKSISLSTSYSSIMDVDYAVAITKYTNNQILRDATASLLTQANINSTIALNLLTNQTSNYAVSNFSLYR